MYLLTFTLTTGLFWSFGEKTIENSAGNYPEHIEGAFTGGFGEETCHSCHFDYDLNQEGGALEILGIPAEIQPGHSYEIEISVERDDLTKAGFQLTSRFADGSQAGVFELSDNERVMLTKAVPDSLQYVQHSPSGTMPSESSKTDWAITWQSPATIGDSIYFNVAANAANGDQSEFGDWIYIKEVVIGMGEE